MFDSPLFGGASTGTYRLYARQSMFDGADASAWFADGFPNYVSDFGIAATAVPFQGARVDVVGGDFVLGPLRPASFMTVSRETYPLRGLSIQMADASARWSAFAGAAKYFEPPPAGPWSVPTLFGLQRLADVGANHWGVSLTGVARATFLDPALDGHTGVVLAGDYFRDLGATAKLFLQGMGTATGDPGGRFGVQLRNPGWDFSTQVYAFGNGFPFVSPLYRPGERGIEIAGRFDPAYRWSLSGYANLLRDVVRYGRTELRGDLGISWNPGGTFPALRLDYVRDEVANDSRSIAVPGATSDRITFQAARSYTSQFWALRAEHVLRDSVGSPERSQATFDYRRIVLDDSFLTGSAVMQRETGGDLGATAESAIERPFKADWFYIAGLGAGLVAAGGGRTGEGVLRGGIAHRFAREGWYARLEVRIPFSIGVERANLATQTLAFDLGTRVGWHGRSDPPHRFTPVSGEPFGALEGAATLNGNGVAGLRVLVNGEHAATTGSSGRYRIPKVRTGPVDVSIDLRNLDPRYTVVGGPVRQVEVPGGWSTKIDFKVEPRSFLRGSLLACEGGEVLPVRGARLTLAAGAWARTVETSPLGAFEMDEIPPGVYTLEIEAGAGGRTAPTLPQPLSIDLRDDVLGFVLRLGCDPEPPRASAEGASAD